MRTMKKKDYIKAIVIYLTQNYEEKLKLWTNLYFKPYQISFFDLLTIISRRKQNQITNFIT